MSGTMNEQIQSALKKAELSDKEFKQLSEFVYKECAIKMSDAKKNLLESRLQKRLRLLELNSFSDYCKYLFSPEGMKNELIHMIDVVTTNKTDFFREPAHFDYLVKKALPELMTQQGAGINRNLMIWSAGCSSGEEPYTLAMVMSEYIKKHPGFRFNFTILATDISTRILERAKHAIYTREKVEPIPTELKRKYLLKSKDPKKKIVRIVPELRETVKFRRLNFLDGDFGMREQMDIIFCRNVIIYFDKKTQETLMNRFCNHLRPGGYLLIGHSETLNGVDLPLEQVAPTIYRKIS